ncbi:MAG: hypothetical protein ACRDBL_04580 [Rhabdaerophilum sp.]
MAAPEWLAAVERGAAEAAEAALGVIHGAAAPSSTPYLDLAFAGGEPEALGIDLSGARALRWGEFQRLLAAGVPSQFAAQLNAGGDLLAAPVELLRGGRFAMGGPDGRLLLVVRDERGVPADALALRMDDPGAVASWFGGCSSGMLGAFNLPSWRAGRVALVETPLAWLRGGGAGICVYDWAAAVPHLRALGEAVTLEAPPALAAILRARLERGGLPLVASAVADGARLSLAERIGRRGVAS